MTRTIGGDDPEIVVDIDMRDEALAQRMIALLSDDPRLYVVQTGGGGRLAFSADVILVDHMERLRGPSIIIDDGVERLEVLNGDIRAILATDVDSELLCAAVIVVASGYFIAGAADGAVESENVLTARENEVLQLLAQGASNKAIARNLAI